MPLSGRVLAPAPCPRHPPQTKSCRPGTKKAAEAASLMVLSTACYDLACLITEVRVLTRPEMFAKSVGRIMVLPSLASLPNCSR